MDKGFVIVYELTAETTTEDINLENTPMKFASWIDAKYEMDKFPDETIFQVMTIGKLQTIKYKVGKGIIK